MRIGYITCTHARIPSFFPFIFIDPPTHTHIRHDSRLPIFLPAILFFILFLFLDIVLATSLTPHIHPTLCATPFPGRQEIDYQTLRITSAIGFPFPAPPPPCLSPMNPSLLFVPLFRSVFVWSVLSLSLFCTTSTPPPPSWLSIYILQHGDRYLGCNKRLLKCSLAVTKTSELTTYINLYLLLIAL